MSVVLRFCMTRSMVALCCGAWVGVWVLTLFRMGVLDGPGRYLALIALLVVVQSVSRRWLQSGLSILVVVSALIQLTWRLIPAPKTPAVWWKVERDAVLDLLIRHATSQVLTVLLFGLIFSILFGLLLYSSQYARLWLFYQGLALFALIMIHINTSVAVTPALLAILAIAAVGFALQSYERMITPDTSARHVFRFLLPVLGVLAAALPLSAIAPKPALQWRMIAQYVQSWFHSQVPTGTVAAQLGPADFNRVGFRAGAQALGGSVTSDYLPVLSVITPIPAYLRGQVLVNYTGHSWQPSASQTSQTLRSDGATANFIPTFSGLPRHRVTQTIKVLGGGLQSNLVLGAYSILVVHGLNLPLSTDPATHTVLTRTLLPPDQSYSVTSAELLSPYGYLARASHPWLPVSSRLNLAAYLALPSSFPHRDRVLAATITRGAVTEYQKVQDVERYLDTHERYATSHIPVPGTGQDYVDQFLFQTHRGYCNNFSTSMAVLLRSVGIPTRWVTGFTSGTEDKTYTGPMNRYVIRNSDAHSWVEVYFPKVGWIPFDPTPGYQMFPLVAAGGGPGQPSTAGGSTNPKGWPPTGPTPVTPNGSGSNPGGQSNAAGGLSWFTSKWIWLVTLGVGATLAVFGWIALRMRRLGHHAPRESHAAGAPNARNSGMGGSAALVQAVVAANLHGDKVSQRGTTIRNFAGSAQDAGLTVQEFQRFVQCVEKLWYSETPLLAEEEGELCDIGRRWLLAMDGTKRRT